MENITVHQMKKGVLVTLDDYNGEEDYYRIHQTLIDVLQPEDEGYSVDSMCIGGYFIKNGILIRTSSESPFDACSFFYEPSKLKPEEESLIMEWIEKTEKALRSLS